MVKVRKLVVYMEDDDEILEREAKKFGGNASHIILPAKHTGKKVTIICAEKVEESKK